MTQISYYLWDSDGEEGCDYAWTEDGFPGNRHHRALGFSGLRWRSAPVSDSDSDSLRRCRHPDPDPDPDLFSFSTHSYILEQK